MCPRKIVVTAILDALKALKEKDRVLTLHIVDRLDSMPIAWNAAMVDSDLYHAHVEEHGYMMLNASAFANKFSRRQRAALMLHELVHFAIGGTELDAEAIEQWVFPDVASAPTTDDRILFHTDQGRYVTINLQSGNVQLKRDPSQIIAHFQVPSHLR